MKAISFQRGCILWWMVFFLAGNFSPNYTHAQQALRLRHNESGIFSLGLRTGIVLTNNEGWNIGLGWGAQARVLANKHINTEWYFEFFNGGYTDYAVRTDGHIGALVLLYPQRRPQRVAPFLAIGPNASYIRLRDRLDKENFTSRWSIAAQAGIGMHINITRRSDITISTSYIIDFGKEMGLVVDDSQVVTLPKSGSGPDGQFLFNISMNYKMADLWRRLKF